MSGNPHVAAANVHSFIIIIIIHNLFLLLLMSHVAVAPQSEGLFVRY